MPIYDYVYAHMTMWVFGTEVWVLWVVWNKKKSLEKEPNIADQEHLLLGLACPQQMHERTPATYHFTVCVLLLSKRQKKHCRGWKNIDIISKSLGC